MKFRATSPFVLNGVWIQTGEEFEAGETFQHKDAVSLEPVKEPEKAPEKTSELKTEPKKLKE